MASTVIYSTEFDRYMERGLAPDQYKYRLLAEGDSWMERSSVTTPSLPDYLARAMASAGDDVLIVNLARFGDTMRRIGECANGDLRQWVVTDFNWKFDAILLSAGGNDFIDAARDPDPGQGIILDMAGRQPPLEGADCLDRVALDRLVLEYLEPNFVALYEQVQASRHAGVPILLNQYDLPVARDAPAFPGGKSWLHAAYVKNQVPPGLWAGLTEAIFLELRLAIEGWTAGRANCHVVPTFGNLLPADPASPANSNDWLNEIHPNPTGWKKLAALWRHCLRTWI
jgi:lysophospholipase L1-like esterase